MKAKITWVAFLLMALSLAADSKNFCGKKLPHSLAAAPCCDESISQPGTGSMATEEEPEAPGASCIKLFLFQLK